MVYNDRRYFDTLRAWWHAPDLFFRFKTDLSQQGALLHQQEKSEFLRRPQFKEWWKLLYLLLSQPHMVVRLNVVKKVQAFAKTAKSKYGSMGCRIKGCRTVHHLESICAIDLVIVSNWRLSFDDEILYMVTWLSVWFFFISWEDILCSPAFSDSSCFHNAHK